MYQSFRDHHPRQYRTINEQTSHYHIFRERLSAVVQNDLQKTTRTFQVGINKFSDWSPDELQILRGARLPSSGVRSKFITMSSSRMRQTKLSGKRKAIPTPTIPAIFDYTTRFSALNSSTPIIRPVRDQGKCGSCYAFAITTLFEAQYAFHYGLAVNMSDQQIVDCSTGDHGCIGGYFDTSFNYIKSYDWYLNSASTYPYKGVATTCSAKKSDGWSVGNTVYRHLTPNNASAMQEALVTYGPLWVSLYVGSDCPNNTKSVCPVAAATANYIMNTFQSYKGGIFQVSGCKTSADENNHAMVIVGYGYDTVTKLDYWKLRNSWGDEWGEHGYIRIVRGVNMCNIESDAFFIAKPAA